MMDYTQPTADLLAYLTGLKGSRLLLGQHADYEVAGMMDQVPKILEGTGRQVAMLGIFFSLGKFTANGDPVTMANQWLARGGLPFGMFSPGNPTYSAQIIGGPMRAAGYPGGFAVNFSNLLVPGTLEYTRWYAGLDQLIAQFKAIDGPILVRAFPEMNRKEQWYGGQPAAEFVELWQGMVNYVRAAGVTNVLWVWNVGGGVDEGRTETPEFLEANYPGAAHVDLVSLDSYPPNVKDSIAIEWLTATGKPVMFAEFGCMKGNPMPAPFSGDTSTALEALLTLFPQVVAACVWGANFALPEQNGMVDVMHNPKIIRLEEFSQR